MEEVNLNGQSHDIVKENVAKLKQLFPEIVTEDNIDFDKLKAVLGEYIEKNDESYRFTWYGKRDALKKSQIPSTGTLRPCIEDSKDWDTTQNLYIEGDNLEVLKLLQKSYNNKIKMIYIDPPYNKDKDFIYPDKWSDPVKEYKKITGQVNEEGNINNSETEEEGGRHTKWLNMMYPRLRLARNLLTNDGYICMQIDDVELDNLKKIGNEVFGEENFVTIIAVKMSQSTGMKMSHADKRLPKLKEYILVYKKEKSIINTVTIPKDKWDNEYRTFLNHITLPEIEFIKRVRDNEERTDEDIKKCDEILSKVEYVSLSSIYENNGINSTVEKEAFNFNNAWRIVQTVSMTGGAKRIADSKKDESSIFYSIQTSENKMYIIKGDYDEQVETPRIKVLFADDYLTVNPCDFWNDIRTTGLDNEGYVDFKNGKKPIKLIMRLIKMFSNENDIILDFFAGSSTTAHSVLQLNYDESSQRKFIMVQLPENLDEQFNNADKGSQKKEIKNTIAFLDEINKPHLLTEIGKERIRLAGEDLKKELQKKYDYYQKKEQSNIEIIEKKSMNPDDLDIGFKVFKLDNTNLKKWAVDVGDDFYKESKEMQNAILSEKLGLEVDNFVEGRSELDVVYEIMLKYGLDLTYPIETYNFNGKNIYSIGYGGLIVCLDTDINTELADKIVALVEELEPSMVRVAVRDLSFKTDSDKTNFKETLKNGVCAYFDKNDNKTDKQNQFKFITI